MILRKLQSKLQEIIEYSYQDDNLQKVVISDFLNKQISIEWTGKIVCQSCSKDTKKSFGEGFCYACFLSAPEAAPCILRPELCQAHLGIGRDVEFEEKNHNQPHVVYFSANDFIKVGITRSTQVPTRWIDQGAAQAMEIAIVPNRYIAGVLEVALKSFYSDKTNWRSMLTNKTDDSIDLIEEKWKIAEKLPHDLNQFWSDQDKIVELNYPILQYPEKVTSLGLDKTPLIEGTLTGIRGQYLFIDGNKVLNVRKHTGYEVQLSLDD